MLFKTYLVPSSSSTCSLNAPLSYYRLNAGLSLRDGVLTQQRLLCIFQQHQFMGWLLSVPSPMALSPTITLLYMVTQRRTPTSRVTLEIRVCSSDITHAESGRLDGTAAKQQDPKTLIFEEGTWILWVCSEKMYCRSIQNIPPIFMSFSQGYTHMHLLLDVRSGWQIMWCKRYNSRPANTVSKPRTSASQASSGCSVCIVHWPVCDHHWFICPSDAENRSK